MIDALAAEHLLVILDNHMSGADWCCTPGDNNGLWYNATYPETKWWSTSALAPLSARLGSIQAATTGP